MSLPEHDGIKGRDWLNLFLQTVVIACAVIAAISVQMEWKAIVGMSFLGVSLIALQVARRSPWMRAWPLRWPATTCFNLLAWMGLLLTTTLWDLNFGAMATLISAVVVAANHRTASAPRRARLNALVFVWLAFLSLSWLGTGWVQNLRGAFYSGFLAILALLVLCRRWFNISPVGLQIVNTFVLVLAGLPAADLIYQCHHEPEIQPETFPNCYSYENARGDPKAFVLAQAYMMQQYNRMGEKVFEPTSQTSPSFRLRPNSHGFLVRCPVFINSNGFRGKNISGEKGNTYRIVALGESTTFGMTYEPDDKTWPELLEQMIRERLKLRRSVEVINAGVPTYTIYDNLHRLAGQILPLKPDMIISYHGANGFYLIDETLLRPVGAAPPSYEERPLKLAADFEYRIRLMLFRNRERPKAFLNGLNPANPMQTKYAKAYRELIQNAAGNGIRLMLANYAMPVTEKSNPAVIDFYQGGGGDSVHGRIKANMIHSEIVRQLTAQHPEVGLIDTYPHLDGEHRKFTDLMHFNQEGRQQLAENIFAGISNTLQKDLGQ